MLTGANVATVIVMLLVGFSDRIHPADHPLVSTLGMAFPILLVINMAFLLFWLIFKWTRAWIPVVGYVLAYVPISIYMPINASSSPPEGALKLVSYNVCSYGGNYKYEQGFEKVRDYLVDEKADIVCLQEDNDSWRRYCFKQYEERGLAYNDTVVLCHDAMRFNCLGIHTRFPIIRRERIDYPTASNNGSVAWWLQVDNDTLIVVNNHFESCHLNQEDRAQYRQLLKGEIARDSVRAESQLLMVKLAEANAIRSEQIERIKKFEEMLTELETLLHKSSPSNDELEAMQESARQLEQYLQSDLWKQDYEDDEKGLLPHDLKRGVLSEDGIYNALEEYRELLGDCLDALEE